MEDAFSLSQLLSCERTWSERSTSCGSLQQLLSAVCRSTESPERMSEHLSLTRLTVHTVLPHDYYYRSYSRSVSPPQSLPSLPSDGSGCPHSVPCLIPAAAPCVMCRVVT